MQAYEHAAICMWENSQIILNGWRRAGIIDGPALAKLQFYAGCPHPVIAAVARSTINAVRAADIHPGEAPSDVNNDGVA